HFKEPVPKGTREFERLNDLRTRLREILCGDPLPDHAAALLRRVGSHNSKYPGEPRLVRVLQEAEPVDILDLEEVVDMLGRARLFTPKPATPKSNGHAHAPTPQSAADERKAPIDIVERLAAMTHKGPGDRAVHQTQLQVTASMLRAGQCVDD